MDARTGRSWRNLQDVSRSAAVAVLRWRAVDDPSPVHGFRPEGPLLWLQVDSVLREKSKGARSLDNFAADFFGPPDGAIEVKPYTYQDLISELNQVVPYDLNALLQGDLLATRPTPVSPGLEAAGWTVVYTDEPNQAAVDAGKYLPADRSLNFDRDGHRPGWNDRGCCS